MKVSRVQWTKLHQLALLTHEFAVACCFALPLAVLVVWVDDIVKTTLFQSITENILAVMPPLAPEDVQNGMWIIHEGVLVLFVLTCGLLPWLISIFLFSGCPWWYFEGYTAVKAGLQENTEYQYKNTRMYRYITHPISQLFRNFCSFCK